MALVHIAVDSSIINTSIVLCVLVGDIYRLLVLVKIIILLIILMVSLR